MPTQTISTEPLDKLIGQVNSLADVDFTPLTMEWEAILKEDNQAGALAGLDGFGVPLLPVTYRPKERKTYIVRKETGAPGLFDTLANNNLSSSMYRTLDGPPLAPRGMESRIINNFITHPMEQPGAWVVIGSWEHVVSISGVSFLGAHFRGEGNLPVRDLAHVRPSAMARAKVALHDFAVALIQKLKGH